MTQRSEPLHSTSPESIKGGGLRITRGGTGVLERLVEPASRADSASDGQVGAEVTTPALLDASDASVKGDISRMSLDDLVDTEIKSYRIVSIEQTSPLGGILRAQHATLNLKAWVHALHLEQAIPDVAQRDVFWQRLSTAQRLHHPHVIRFLGVETVAPFTLLMTECPDVTSIYELVLREGGVPEERALSIAEGVLDVLMLGLDQNLRHDALCPENLFLTATDHLKMIDYGWPTYGMLASPNHPLPHSALGGARHVAPLWTRSPELLMGVGTPDHRSDIYALGATLYFMLTGQPPYRATTVADLLYEQGQSAPIAPQQLNPDLTENSSTLILSMMHQELDQRPSTYHELHLQISRAMIQIRNIKLRRRLRATDD